MSADTLRVAVIGAGGRLGSHACALLERSPGYALVARIGRGDDLAAALARSGAQVAFESTRAGQGAANARLLLERGVRPLVATSGVTAAEARALDELARGLDLGGLIAPNLSLGMWLLQRAAEEAARHLPRAEIVELHHDRKVDAPSGTALDTALRLAAVRAAAGKNTAAVPIHSLRLPGARAHQEVVFGGPGELYTLRHDALGPEAYDVGILAGLRHVASARGVQVGIGAAFAPER